jgi:hypothetical protein
MQRSIQASDQSGCSGYVHRHAFVGFNQDVPSSRELGNGYASSVLPRIEP